MERDLRELGLKVTGPRLKILELFEQAPENHFSADQVFSALREAGEDVGLATVYRVLTQFEKAGLLKRHNFEEGHAVYELELGEHHDHLVCVKCGQVLEFIDKEIEARQEAMCQQYGFQMTDHSLTIYGLCPTCQQ